MQITNFAVVAMAGTAFAYPPPKDQTIGEFKFLGNNLRVLCPDNKASIKCYENMCTIGCGECYQCIKFPDKWQGSSKTFVEFQPDCSGKCYDYEKEQKPYQPKQKEYYPPQKKYPYSQKKFSPSDKTYGDYEDYEEDYPKYQEKYNKYPSKGYNKYPSYPEKDDYYKYDYPPPRNGKKCPYPSVGYAETRYGKKKQRKPDNAILQGLKKLGGARDY